MIVTKIIHIIPSALDHILNDARIYMERTATKMSGDFGQLRGLCMILTAAENGPAVSSSFHILTASRQSLNTIIDKKDGMACG